MPAVVVYYVNGLQKAEVINTYESGTNYLTQESWKHYGAASRQVTQYLYDSKGMVLKKTDPAGITTTYSYDAKNRLQKEKDHLNNGTDYEYDVWDRLVKTTRPSGEITTNASIWATNATGSLYMSQTVTSGKPVTQVYYDPLNREVRKGEMRFDGRYLYTDIAYDNIGRKQKQSLPYIGSDPVRWNTFNYDIYDRNTSVVFASGRTDTYSYSANSITSVTEDISKVYTYDVAGLLTTLADPGGTTSYVYRADGKPASVNVAGAVTTLEYDNYGRQTAIVDLGAGRKTFTYDTAGNLATDTDARGKTTKLGYDERNRLIRKEFVGEQTITYTYNQNNFLVSEVSTNGTSAYFTPDSLLRVKTVKETGADGNWLQKDFTYSYGNIYTIAYAANTGSIATETYKYANGHLSELLAGSISVWKLTKENDMGQQAEVKNNNTVLVQTYSYDDYGLPKTRMVKNSGNTVIQDDIYTFNAQNGNLLSRKDNKRNLLENFTYDNMHRLTGFSGKTVTYDNRGNITNISDVGSMSYSSVKPYQMSAMPLMTNSIYPQRSQLISYNTMMLPTSIIENGYTATVAYNGGGERVKMELKKNNVAELTRHYLGNQYEKDSGVAGTKEKLYIGGDPYSAAAVMVKEGTGSWQIHYLCRDYLGSITQIVNAAGNLVQELSYDAWGRLRNPLTQALYAAGSEPAPFLGRGYTGHEHMPWFALINMNARLYDSVLCRFLTPDPYIVSLEFSQLFNRYSYGANNPLRFTDPTGKFIWLAFGIAALVIGIVSVTAAALAGEIHSIGDGLKAFFTGAFVGAALVVTWYYLPAVPYVGKFLAGALKIYAIAQAAMTTVGIAGGLIHDAMGGFKDLNGLGNAVKLFYGNFYFNNRGLRGPVEGYLRHTWEMLQNFGGYAFAMGRNMFGFVDRVDYFGGATFATNENSQYHSAVSLSGYININIWEEIDRPFKEYIMFEDAMYMHEYGHRHDSRLFGYLYLFAIGVPSAAGAQYTEIWANRNAKNYFKKFGVNWDSNEGSYPTK